MRTIVVDCSGVATPDEFWQRYIEAAQPIDDGFGRNLDAFWDAIEAGGPGWPGTCKLIFNSSDSLAHLRLAGGGSFLDALRKVARDSTQLEVLVS